MPSPERIISRLSPTWSRAAPSLGVTLQVQIPAAGNLHFTVSRHSPGTPIGALRHTKGSLRGGRHTRYTPHAHPLSSHARPPCSEHLVHLAHPMSSTSTRFTHMCTSVRAGDPVQWHTCCASPTSPRDPEKPWARGYAVSRLTHPSAATCGAAGKDRALTP